jgi:REP element-mobilizing transposase RayT
MDKFKGKYRIPSARASWHDYSGGLYFVTVCTQGREHFFGEVVDCRRDVADNVSAACHVPVACRDVACRVSTLGASMQLTVIGQYLHECLSQITNHCPYAEIPVFTIMPNHFHAIVSIDADYVPVDCRDVACRVSTCRVSTMPTVPNKMRDVAEQQGLLSIVVGGLKSSVTRFAHRNDIRFAWQTRFHDHIIRNQHALNTIATYIENNPAHWKNDKFYVP